MVSEIVWPADRWAKQDIPNRPPANLNWSAVVQGASRSRLPDHTGVVAERDHSIRVHQGHAAAVEVERRRAGEHLADSAPTAMGRVITAQRLHKHALIALREEAVEFRAGALADQHGDQNRPDCADQ